MLRIHFGVIDSSLQCRGMQQFLEKDIERDYRYTETIGYHSSKRIDSPLGSSQRTFQKSTSNPKVCSLLTCTAGRKMRNEGYFAFSDLALR